MFARILKANPYHDGKGRFAAKDKAASSVAPTEKALLGAHGVKVAAPGSELDSLVGGSAYGGPLKKKSAQTTKSWEGTVKDLNATMDDMSARFGLDFKPLGIALLSRDSATHDSSGIAALGGRALAFSSTLQDKKSVARDKTANEDFAKANNGRQWGVPESLIAGKKVTEAVRQEYVQAVMRHEIGHLLTRPNHVRAFLGAMKEMGATRKWAKDNISVYGASKTIEAIAESFSMYTDKSYKKGTLPSSVEGVIESILGGAKATSKKSADYIPASMAYDSVSDDAAWDNDIPKVETAPKGFRGIMKRV